MRSTHTSKSNSAFGSFDVCVYDPNMILSMAIIKLQKSQHFIETHSSRPKNNFVELSSVLSVSPQILRKEF